MKVMNLERATLDTCVRESQHERVVITHEGKPVALIVGVEGLDREVGRIRNDVMHFHPDGISPDDRTC